MKTNQRRTSTKNAEQGERIILEALREALRRSQHRQAELFNMMFEPGPVGSRHKWVLATEPLTAEERDLYNEEDADDEVDGEGFSQK